MDDSERRIVNHRLLSSFPALAGWFNDNTGTFDLWCGDVSDYEHSDVLSSIDRIRKGEVDRPRGHQDLLQTVLKTAKSIAYERNPVKTHSQFRQIDGQDTFQCPTCRDSGLIDVVSPADGVSIDTNRSERVRIKTCVVSCDCEHGRSWRDKRSKPLLEYDPARMCKIDPGTDAEQWRQYEAWRDDYRPPNYNHDLADWGETVA